MAKPFARRFYSSKAWQDCRNGYAKSVHHLCEDCLRRGIYKPGEIVHHIIPITPETIERPEVALSYSNLEMLCRDCHAERHGLGHGKAGQRAPGRPTDRYFYGKNGEIIPR